MGCQHSDTAQISIHSVCALIIQKIDLYVADDFGKPLAGQGACIRLIRGSPASVFSSRFLDNWHYIVMKSSLGKTMDRRKALFGPGEVIQFSRSSLMIGHRTMEYHGTMFVLLIGRRFPWIHLRMGSRAPGLTPSHEIFQCPVALGSLSFNCGDTHTCIYLFIHNYIE